MKRLSLRAHSLTFLGVIACGGETLDLGSNRSSVAGTAGSAANGGAGATSQGGNAGSTVSGAPLPAWPEMDCSLTEPMPLEGTWAGYFQGAGPYAWPGNLRVEFSKGTAGGAPCGIVTFGDGEPPPPQTDPEVPYPLTPTGYATSGTGLAGSLEIPMAGFPFTILEATKEQQRLVFRVALSEPWREWCSLQTPIARSTPGEFGCTLGGGYLYTRDEGCATIDPQTEETVAIDCAKAGVCESDVCVCNESACAGNPNSRMATFDLHFDDDVAMGVLADHAVVLERID